MTVIKASDESEAILVQSFQELSVTNTNVDDLCKTVIDKARVLLAKNDIKWKQLLARSPGGSYFSNSQQGSSQSFLTKTDGAVYFNINGQVFPLDIHMSDQQYLAVANSEEFKRFVEEECKSPGVPSPDVKQHIENLKRSLDPEIKVMHWLKTVSLDLDQLFLLDCNNKSLLHYAVESKIDCKESFYCIFTRMKKYPDHFKKFFTDTLRDSIHATLQNHKYYDLLDFFEDGFTTC